MKLYLKDKELIKNLKVTYKIWSEEESKSSSHLRPIGIYLCKSKEVKFMFDGISIPVETKLK